MTQNQHEVFEVFFDGKCPLCKREIDMVRRKDKQQRLKLTDIAAVDFQPVAGKSLLDLSREIHGRNQDGSLVTGVDVFREIYSRIGYGWLVTVSRLPILRKMLDIAYYVFAKLRFRHAMFRIKRAKVDCRQCQIENE